MDNFSIILNHNAFISSMDPFKVLRREPNRQEAVTVLGKLCIVNTVRAGDHQSWRHHDIWKNLPYRGVQRRKAARAAVGDSGRSMAAIADPPDRNARISDDRVHLLHH